MVTKYHFFASPFSLLTNEDFWVDFSFFHLYLNTLEPFVMQRSALLFRGWQPNFQKWLQNFDFTASNFNIDCPLTSMASKTSLSYISKIASNQYICFNNRWEVWIVGRDNTKTKCPKHWGVVLIWNSLHLSRILGIAVVKSFRFAKKFA